MSLNDKKNIDKRITKLLQDGYYINAIKEARLLVDGLKEAKEYVDKIRERQILESHQKNGKPEIKDIKYMAKKNIMSNFDGWMAIDIIELLSELIAEVRSKAAQASRRIQNERQHN